MPLSVAAIVVLVVLLVVATLLYLQRKRLAAEVAKERKALLNPDDEFFKIGDGDDDAYSLADSNPFKGPHIIIER